MRVSVSSPGIVHLKSVSYITVSSGVLAPIPFVIECFIGCLRAPSWTVGVTFDQVAFVRIAPGCERTLHNPAESPSLVEYHRAAASTCCGTVHRGSLNCGTDVWARETTQSHWHVISDRSLRGARQTIRMDSRGGLGSGHAVKLVRLQKHTARMVADQSATYRPLHLRSDACLNEAETLSPCITKDTPRADGFNVKGRSRADKAAPTARRAARGLGARVVDIREVWAALQGGCELRAEFVVMGDSMTVTSVFLFSALGPFSQVRAGYDLAWESFLGGISREAMPPVTVLCNPVLTGSGRCFLRRRRRLSLRLRGFNRDSSGSRPPYHGDGSPSIWS